MAENETRSKDNSFLPEPGSEQPSSAVQQQSHVQQHQSHVQQQPYVQSELVVQQQPRVIQQHNVHLQPLVQSQTHSQSQPHVQLQYADHGGYAQKQENLQPGYDDTVGQEIKIQVGSQRNLQHQNSAEFQHAETGVHANHSSVHMQISESGERLLQPTGTGHAQHHQADHSVQHVQLGSANQYQHHKAVSQQQHLPRAVHIQQQSNKDESSQHQFIEAGSQIQHSNKETEHYTQLQLAGGQSHSQQSHEGLPEGPPQLLHVEAGSHPQNLLVQQQTDAGHTQPQHIQHHTEQEVPQQLELTAVDVHQVVESVEGGDQYVTIVQDGQTYAIPLADYEAMLGKVEINTVQEHQEPTSDSTVKGSPEAGMSMSWMSAGVFEPPTSKRKIISNLGSQKSVKPVLRPIKVDNWGIFLLDRLQSCFQRKELCDLTVRFPDKNAQIKMHKLVVNACTEYFMNAEKEGKLVEGIMDMPANFVPEAMAPIIRFMYTGKLEVKEDSFQRLYDTARLLNMSVLIKLLDAQLNPPLSNTDQENKNKRKSSVEDDPVNQVKKFKKIEEIVKQEEAKATKLEKLKSLYKLKQKEEELEKMKLPGKKLPIWKKRVFGASEPSNPTMDHIDPMPENVKTELKSPLTTETRSYIIPKLGEPSPKKFPPTTYQRKQSPDKPKIPRKLREIQAHLLFEKVLRTGSKNTLMQRKDGEEGREPLSAEEIKELGEQQAQRKDVENDDEEDYFDNDTEFITDEYLGDNDSPAPQPQPEEEEENTQQPSEQITSEVPKNTVEPGRKTVLFSIKPESTGSYSAPSELSQSKSSTSTSPSTSTPLSMSAHTTSLPCKTPKAAVTPILQSELDDALDEFTRVAEEEAMEEEGSNETQEMKKPRRGRPPKVLQEKMLSMAPSPPVINEIKKEIPVTKSDGVDQSRMIADLLKKYPKILKDNKPVKIRMSVIENGKPTVQVITLKPQGAPSKPVQQQFNPSSALKNLPKVLYTGRRGRPKKLKPGEVDPHAEQRRKIKENLKKNCPSLARQLEEEEDEPDVQICPEIPEPAGSWLDQTNNPYQNTQRVHQIGANHQIQAQLVSQHPDNQHGLVDFCGEGGGGGVGIGSGMQVDGTNLYQLVQNPQEYLQILDPEDSKYVYVMDLKAGGNVLVQHTVNSAGMIVPSTFTSTSGTVLQGVQSLSSIQQTSVIPSIQTSSLIPSIQHSVIPSTTLIQPNTGIVSISSLNPIIHNSSVIPQTSMVIPSSLPGSLIPGVQPVLSSLNPGQILGGVPDPEPEQSDKRMDKIVDDWDSDAD